MPKGIYSNVVCKNVNENDFVPTVQQRAVRSYFAKPINLETGPYKGLLLYHKLGSGKTCTAIITADAMLAKGLVKKVFVLSPGSLRSGWIKEYCEVCGKSEKTMSKKYIFVTTNYSTGDRIPDLNNSLVIIDEVHNLINGVKNESKNASKIYKKIASSNCRILALSGTPIYNFLYEFAIIGNLLKPGLDFPIFDKKGNIDTYEFMNLFTTDDNGEMVVKNQTSMERRLSGIVSYYPGADKKYLPEVIHMPPFKIEMSMLQEINYWEKVYVELKLTAPRGEDENKDPKLAELFTKLKIMARKKIMSRSASNFFYDMGFKTKCVKVDNKRDDEIKFKMIPDYEKQKGGWVTKKVFRNRKLVEKYSPKFAVLLANIVIHHKQKHLIFTFFKTKAGSQMLHTILGMCGITSEIFSGDLDDFRRTYLLKRFNEEQNNYGDNIRVLIVTEAGAEGINVLNVRHMHILESSPRINKIVQAIGRVARYKSHINLPEDERNVKIWKYWSVSKFKRYELSLAEFKEENPSDFSFSKNMITTDEFLYENGIKTLKEIHHFLNIVKKVSVTPYKEDESEYNWMKDKETIRIKASYKQFPNLKVNIVYFYKKKDYVKNEDKYRLEDPFKHTLEDEIDETEEKDELEETKKEGVNPEEQKEKKEKNKSIERNKNLEKDRKKIPDALKNYNVMVPTRITKQIMEDEKIVDKLIGIQGLTLLNTDVFKGNVCYVMYREEQVDINNIKAVVSSCPKTIILNEKEVEVFTEIKYTEIKASEEDDSGF